MARRVIDGSRYDEMRGANVYTLLASAEVEHSARLNRCRKGWKFYRGNHWDWQRDESEPFVTFNYARLFVDSMVFYLFGKGFNITIPDDPSTLIPEDLERDFVRYALNEVWRQNDQDLVSLEMGQQGSVTGDVFVRVSWEPDDPMEGPHPRVDVIPSEFVFPDFGGPRGVDRKKVNSILILFPRYQVGNELEPGRGLFGAEHKKVEVYGERWYRDKVYYYHGNDWDPEEKPNPYGEIPIVHIPNLPISGEYFGMNDLDDIIDLNRELNEKATDVSDVINYHGSPITLVSGAKIAQLERGANRIWGIPEGAEVSNLELKGDLSAAMNYVRFIKNAMHEIGHIPESALGTIQQGIKDLSGSALSMRFIPLTMVRNIKTQTYGSGLRNINRLILRTLELKDPEFRDKFSRLRGNRYRNDIVFPDPLPRNEAVELDNSKKRLELGLSTIALELEKSGKSQGEIHQVLTGIVDDAKLKARLEFAIGAGYMPEGEEPSGNPNPVRQSPDLQGQKRSITAERKAEEEF